MSQGSFPSEKGICVARDVAQGVRAGEPGRIGGGQPPGAAVLVVASDPAWGGKLVAALQRRGFPAPLATTAADALRWARRLPPRLTLVDLAVAESPGFLWKLRREGRAVLALSSDREARARALEAGCLDAITPDVDARELALKVAALVKGSCSVEGQIVAGPLLVDPDERRLCWRGREVSLSPLLFDLAVHLGANAGRILPARALLDEVWGEPWAHPNKVHQAMWRLRRSLGEPADSSCLVGRPRHGYGLLPDGAAAAPSLSMTAS